MYKKRKGFKCVICRQETGYKGICFDCRISKDKQIQKAIKNREIELEQKRKFYDSGVVVDSLELLLSHDWFYFNSMKRPMHREALLSWQARFLINQLKNNRITIAIRK